MMILTVTDSVSLRVFAFGESDGQIVIVIAFVMVILTVADSLVCH